MKTLFEELRGDGSHCGLTDLYKENDAALMKALRSHRQRWDTGWWASKKEIACARVERSLDAITVSVSVSDDFDTEGIGEVTLLVGKRCAGRFEERPIDVRERINKAIGEAWEQAEENQKDNQCYRGFKIGHGDRWEETYIQNVGGFDYPTGGNYYWFGFQEQEEEDPATYTGDLTAEEREAIQEWIDSWPGDGETFSIGEWTVTPWRD